MDFMSQELENKWVSVSGETFDTADPRLTKAGSIKLESAHETMEETEVEFLEQDSVTKTAISEECLICFNQVNLIEDEEGATKSPMSQLNDLLRLFRISTSSMGHVFAEDLPRRLFCDVCAFHIVEAVEIAVRIEVLQNDLEHLRKLLQRDLTRTWMRTDETARNGKNNVRRTLIQCFSSCEVLLKPLQTPNPVKKGDGNAQESGVLNNQIGELSEPEELIEFVDDNFQPSGEELGLDDDDDDGDYKPENPTKRLKTSLVECSTIHSTRKRVRPNKEILPFNCHHCSEGFLSQNALTFHEANLECSEAQSVQGSQKLRKTPTRKESPVDLIKKEKASCRTYDDDGNLISYSCALCGNILSAQDYRMTNADEYVFKCNSDSCCDYSIDSFFDLVCHHEKCCRSKQKPGRKIKKNIISKFLSKGSKSKVTRRWNTSFIYNDSNTVVGFQCPTCEKKLNRSGFLNKDSNDFVFKCDVDGCHKITCSFTNLSFHHQTHCRTKDGPLKSKWKPAMKTKEKIPPKCSSKGSKVTRRRNTSFIYNDSNTVVGFQCPTCKKKLNRSDFLNEDSNEFVFRCEVDGCHKITCSFTNLSFHHQTHCRTKDGPLKSKWKPAMKAKEKIPPKCPSKGAKVTQRRNTSFIYNDSNIVVGFQCPTCEKKLNRSDFLNEDSNEFVFKCDVDSCHKITCSFANLSFHHQTHCRTNDGPRKSKWKSSNKFKNAYRLLNKSKYVTADRLPQSEKGREYGMTGRVIGFTCPRCTKKISYADFFNEESDSYEFKCFSDCCDKVFTTFTNLIFHHEARCNPIENSSTVSKFDTEGNLESFFCLICNETYSNDPDVSLTCSHPECRVVSDNFQELRSHHESHCLKKLIENGLTPNQVYSIKPRKLKATGLMKHSTRQKTGKIFEFVCETCGKGYDRKVSFEEHLKCHEGVLAFECNLCFRKFSNQTNLVKHARHHELSIDQRCTKPEKLLQPSRKQFCTEGSLASYHCQHCDKVILKSECEHGTAEHENEYKCWLKCCDRKFIHFTAMVVHHVASCPSKKPSNCEDCGKSFSNTWKLKQHVRDNHEKVDPLYCDQCGKAFKKKIDLTRHMVTHSDEKPFACSLCPCRYKRRKNLKIHMTLHNDERPFMCSTCGKTFRHKNYLYEHEKAHGMLVKQEVNCTICSQTFKTQRELDFHVKGSHNYDKQNEELN